jgi:hypothetical protein
MGMGHLVGAALAAIGVVAAAPSNATTTLLDLVNPGETSGTDYALSFEATSPDTTLSVGGYQIHSFENVDDSSVTASGGGPNLLGSTWTFVPASNGSDSLTINDGTAVPELAFGAIDYINDTYSQTFATTPGANYVYSFTFVNSYPPSPSALLVTVTATPEPSTWAMMMLGFAGLGYAGWRTSRKVAAT